MRRSPSCGQHVQHANQLIPGRARDVIFETPKPVWSDPALCAQFTLREPANRAEQSNRRHSWQLTGCIAGESDKWHWDLWLKQNYYTDVNKEIKPQLRKIRRRAYFCLVAILIYEVEQHRPVARKWGNVEWEPG